jgi:hypothetical protein
VGFSEVLEKNKFATFFNTISGSNSISFTVFVSNETWESNFVILTLKSF